MKINFEIMRQPGFFTTIEKERKRHNTYVTKHHAWKKISECPVCSERRSKNGEIKDTKHCLHCDCLYMNHIPKNFDWYKDDYEKSFIKPVEKKRDYRKERFGKERIAIIEQHLKKPLSKATLLDVGCATGFFLELAKDKFKTVEGLEINKKQAKQVEEKFGIKVHENLNEIMKKYSVITLFDVIEHIKQPLAFLKQLVSNHLEKGGILFIITPNWRSLSFSLLKEKSNHYYPCEHFQFFSKETGFSVSRFLRLELLMVETRGMDMFDILAFDRDINKTNIKNTFLYKHVNVMQNALDSYGYSNSVRFVMKK